MRPYELLAEAFQYPAPGRIELLREGCNQLPPGAVRKALHGFLQAISRLRLGEWEELHTRTLDLNPPAAPYIGFQMWGESYQRGAFLAKMNRALWEARVDDGGELPDHLIPVLRYLSTAAAPMPELVEVLEPAVQRMITALKKADPHNPYTLLLEAVALASEGIKVQAQAVPENNGPVRQASAA